MPLASGPTGIYGDRQLTTTKAARLPVENRLSGQRANRLEVGIWACLALGVGGVFWASAARPVADPDIWWHVRTGQLILDGGVPHTEPWAYTAYGRPWVPTAWATDALLAFLRDTFGWSGIVGFKLAVSALLLVALGRLLFRSSTGPSACVMFVLVTLVVSPFFSERPQLVSLVLAVWLASQAVSALHGKPWSWWTLAWAYVWANLHGMWVLVPIALVVTMVATAVERGPQWLPRVQRTAALLVGVVGLSALTPAGPRLTYWPLVVRDAADQISEWQPTTLTDKYGIAYLAIFLIWALATARTTKPTRWGEVLWMFAMLLLGLQAGRNVAPTAILMAPVAAAALDRAFPALSTRGRLNHIHPAVPAVIIALAGLLAGWVHVERGSVTDRMPFDIVSTLSNRGEVVRVLNAYNVGGFLTGEGAPEISVAIDGRTDNYDPEFIDRYLLATEQLVRWRSLVADLRPDAAVFRTDSAMTTELRHSGWSEVERDGAWVLLTPPSGRSDR